MIFTTLKLDRETQKRRVSWTSSDDGPDARQLAVILDQTALKNSEGVPLATRAMKCQLADGSIHYVAISNNGQAVKLYKTIDNGVVKYFNQSDDTVYDPCISQFPDLENECQQFMIPISMKVELGGFNGDLYGIQLNGEHTLNQVSKVEGEYLYEIPDALILYQKRFHIETQPGAKLHGYEIVISYFIANGQKDYPAGHANEYPYNNIQGCMLNKCIVSIHNSHVLNIVEKDHNNLFYFGDNMIYTPSNGESYYTMGHRGLPNTKIIQCFCQGGTRANLDLSEACVQVTEFQMNCCDLFKPELFSNKVCRVTVEGKQIKHFGEHAAEYEDKTYVFHTLPVPIVNDWLGYYTQLKSYGTYFAVKDITLPHYELLATVGVDDAGVEVFLAGACELVEKVVGGRTYLGWSVYFRSVRVTAYGLEDYDFRSLATSFFDPRCELYYQFGWGYLGGRSGWYGMDDGSQYPNTKTTYAITNRYSSYHNNVWFDTDLTVDDLNPNFIPLQDITDPCTPLDLPTVSEFEFNVSDKLESYDFYGYHDNNLPFCTDKITVEMLDEDFAIKPTNAITYNDRHTYNVNHLQYIVFTDTLHTDKIKTKNQGGDSLSFIDFAEGNVVHAV